MNGAELTRRPPPSWAGQPWAVVEATGSRRPGAGLQGCSRPRGAALPEERMQGDRSLVCVQTENPGPATRPCCVSCWACRGEANASSFPSPARHRVLGAGSHGGAARGHTAVRRSSACPSGSLPGGELGRTGHHPGAELRTPRGLCPGAAALRVALGRDLPTRLGSCRSGGHGKEGPFVDLGAPAS